MANAIQEGRCPKTVPQSGPNVPSEGICDVVSRELHTTGTPVTYPKLPAPAVAGPKPMEQTQDGIHGKPLLH